MSAQVGDLARHTGIYGIGTIVGGISRAALVPIIARYLTSQEYGKASMVLVFVALLAIVAELGLSSSLIKFVNEASTEDERRRVVATAVKASLMFCIPIGALCALLREPLSQVLLGSTGHGALILVGVVGGVGSAVLQVGLAFERALARSYRYVVYTVLKGGIALGLSVVLVVVLRKGAMGLLIGSAVPAALIGAVVYGRLLRRFAGFGCKILKAVVDFGMPLVPMNLAMWVLAYSDIYLLRRLATAGGGLSEVGLYQYAHEICLVMVVPITSFNLAWPQFIFANHSRPGAAEMFARVHRYLAFFLTGVALLLSVFAKDIIGLVGTPGYMGSSQVMPLLAGSLVFYGFSMAFSSGLYIAGRTRTLAWVVAGCAGLNVGLNIVLIPYWGKQGAAAATLVTNAVMALTVLHFAQGRYRIPFRLGRSILGFALAAGLATALGRMGEGMPIPGVLVRLFASFCVLPALLGILGIKPRELRSAARTLRSLTGGGQTSRNL